METLEEYYDKVVLELRGEWSENSNLYWNYKYVQLVSGFCGNKTNVVSVGIFTVAGLCVHTDFRSLQWLTVNSFLQLCHVDVGDGAKISEVHASIFRVRVCKMDVFPCTDVIFVPSTQNKHGEGGGVVQQATGCTKKPVTFDVPEWSPNQVLIRCDIDYLLCCGRWGHCCVLKLGCSGNGGRWKQEER